MWALRTLMVGPALVAGVVIGCKTASEYREVDFPSPNATYKALTDLPVSAPGNLAYLRSMETRPWWDRAWTRRAAILVSSTRSVRDGNVVVDAIVDFGEKVNPDEVRLVTPWEEIVDCVAERVAVGSRSRTKEDSDSDTKIRLLFRTALRPHENKPFLVYWGNPNAKRPTATTSLVLERTAETVRVLNGKVDVTFDSRHRTDGLIRSLRIVGSDAANELLERATGYAWNGFSFTGVKAADWSAPIVACDNPFKKTIRFECPRATVDFSFFPDQPRVDWTYRLKDNGRETGFGLSFACGGGVAYDEIVYPSLTGRRLAMPAALDHCTDTMKPYSYPNHHPWMSEGWFALRDRYAKDVVGLVFDRAALADLDYWGHGQASGESFNLRFAHDRKTPAGEASVGTGAIVACLGSWRDVEAEYARLREVPRIAVGAPMPYAEHACRIPRLDRDYCADFNIGPGAGSGWASGTPLPGADWATNIVNHLRSYGANVVRIGGMGFSSLPVPKDLYDRCLDGIDKKKAEHIPAWSAEAYDGSNLRTETAAAHAKGMAVNIWGGYKAGCPLKGKDRLDPADIRNDIELQNLYPSVGVDGVYNARAQGEGPTVSLPEAAAKKWRWNFGNATKDRENAEEFFRFQDANTELVRQFYREAKKRNPDKPVVMWNSENSEPGRDMYMTEQAGSFDTVMVEMIPHFDFPHVKHCAKRMRALFDNAAGHTVHHHYYFFKPDYRNRVSQIELPFVCGVNGFSHENLTYENYDRDLSEIAGDFHRFAEYTRLGETVARMAPVKNLAVFRDSAAFRDDIIRKRIGSPYAWKARQDNRVHAFGEIRNFNYDVVINAYFTREALKKYRVVYVPEDPVFSDALAKELLAYVEQGGSAILEGETGKKVKVTGEGEQWNARFDKGEIVTYGKGKILWYREVQTDKFVAGDEEAKRRVRAAVAALGGQDPYDIVSKTLDSVLQSSDEGLFLGVFNRGDAEDSGKVMLDSRLAERSASLWVLDVKRGVRFAYTNGFEITVGPKQCGFYLIGDETFTALPAARPGVWGGASAVVARPGTKAPAPVAAKDFVRKSVVEFVTPDRNPASAMRARMAGVKIETFTRETFDARSCAQAIAKASYVHVIAPGADSDLMFAACGDELKTLLGRGGSILFDKSPAGRAGHAFLGEVGVFDPTPSLETPPLGLAGCYSEQMPTNHPLYIAGREKSKGFAWMEGLKFYTAWSSDQLVVSTQAGDPSRALALVQENVLGAGRVVFDYNYYVFTDWYENSAYCDREIGWFIGMDPKDHYEQMKAYDGGPGEPVE